MRSRARLCGLLGALVLLGGPRLPARDSGTHPVKAFETALHGLSNDRMTEAQAKLRLKKLAEAAKALTRLDDLCRAVLLDAWPDTLRDREGKRVEVPLQEWHREAIQVRLALAKRLVASARTVLAKGSVARQLALLTMISDSGKDKPDEAIFAPLKKDVLDLLQEAKEVQVRGAALRTLPKVQATPAEMAVPLKKGLKAKEVAERRAAAVVLKSVLSPPPVPGNRPSNPFAVLKDQGEALLPLASEGVLDEDGTVRRLCLAGMGGIALELASLMGEIRRFVVDFGNAEDATTRRQMAQEQKRFAGLLRLVNSSLRPAIKALADRDLGVCLAAHKTLRDAADLWLVWRLFLATFPPEKEDKEGKDLLDEPAKAVPALIVSLQHKEVRVRLGAIYVLETLTADAAPAAGALAEALADENRFVRWGAARALRNMAPAGADKAVPALAKMLGDDSPDVRNTSVVALARYGPAGKGAVPALAKVVKTGDAKMRLRAVRALSAIGKEGKEATPALVTALTDKQASVRAAAATALGRMGTLTKAARSALLKALTDEDVEVRRAAAAVLLQE